MVISRDGKTTVLTGWRASLASIAVVVVAWLALAFIAFLALGLAVTVGTIALLLIPAVAVAAFVSSLVRRLA